MVWTSLSLLVCPLQRPKKPTHPCSYIPGTQECLLGQRTHSCGSVAPPWQPCSHAGPRCALSPGAVWILARSALPATGTNTQSGPGGRQESACSRLPSSPVIVPAIHRELEGLGGKGHFCLMRADTFHLKLLDLQGPSFHLDTVCFSVAV